VNDGGYISPLHIRFDTPGDIRIRLGFGEHPGGLDDLFFWNPSDLGNLFWRVLLHPLFELIKTETPFSTNSLS
jgi:hypothetical protein